MRAGSEVTGLSHVQAQWAPLHQIVLHRVAHLISTPVNALYGAALEAKVRDSMWNGPAATSSANCDMTSYLCLSRAYIGEAQNVH